jgi:hypothetical protein
MQMVVARRRRDLGAVVVDIVCENDDSGVVRKSRWTEYRDG